MNFGNLNTVHSDRDLKLRMCLYIVAEMSDDIGKKADVHISMMNKPLNLSHPPILDANYGAMSGP